MIRGDMICFQMIQDFLQNHFILFHTQPAFRTGDDVVRTGIGKVDGMAIFVKDAVPRDRVQAKVMKMKKSYDMFSNDPRFSPESLYSGGYLFTYKRENPGEGDN